MVEKPVSRHKHPGDISEILENADNACIGVQVLSSSLERCRGRLLVTVADRVVAVDVAELGKRPHRREQRDCSLLVVPRRVNAQ